MKDTALGYFFASFIFTLAAFTDWLDGYIARRLKVTSNFGAFLDPVADKLIVTVALVLLVSNKELQQLLVSPILFMIMCSIIICREVFVSALREYMAGKGNRDAVAVSWIGKWKTALQMGAIIILLLHWEPLILVGEIFTYIATILTVWSLVNYIKSAANSFK